MLRRRFLAPALAVLLAGPVLVASPPAGAIDQDLLVSVASGGPGTRIEVSSATCTTVDDDDDEFVLRIVEARLISGDPDRVLAGLASSFGDQPAVLVVPDWVDPDAPAVIEATCTEIGFGDEGAGETVTPFDPVPFDVEPGIDPPQQVLTLSRAELLAGQAFTAEFAGCLLADPDAASATLAPGADRSGANLADAVVGGFTEEGADPQTVEVLVNDASWSLGFSSDGTALSDVTIEEFGTTIEPGSYTLYAACQADGEVLLFEPQAVEITGAAPTDDIDLVVTPQTRSYELAGGSCTQGEVRFGVEEEDLDDLGFFDEPVDDGDLDLRSLRNRGQTADPWSLASFVGSSQRTAGADRSNLVGPSPLRGLLDDLLDRSVVPDGTGVWSSGSEVGFDLGTVSALAACGDPFAEGFLYDPQVALVEVPLPVATQPEAPPVAPPPPANAIPGTPRYTG